VPRRLLRSNLLLLAVPEHLLADEDGEDGAQDQGEGGRDDHHEGHVLLDETPRVVFGVRLGGNGVESVVVEHDHRREAPRAEGGRRRVLLAAQGVEGVGGGGGRRRRRRRRRGIFVRRFLFLRGGGGRRGRPWGVDHVEGHVGRLCVHRVGTGAIEGGICPYEKG